MNQLEDSKCELLVQKTDDVQWLWYNSDTLATKVIEFDSAARKVYFLTQLSCLKKGPVFNIVTKIRSKSMEMPTSAMARWVASFGEQMLLCRG